MAEKTYNTGRVVGWSAYEEFLRETKADPNVITSFVYQTLVTYGVTRCVELKPGVGVDAWRPTAGGQFYIQTIRVPGASWGAVPIIGLDYAAYIDTFTNPNQSEAAVESIDASEKEAIESAVGNIFSVYVSDGAGNKATNSVSPHGYLTFAAYPDILEFNENIPGISGGVLKLIVRGLSMEDLDVDSLYYGPQGFIFAGNGLAEDCYHVTQNINNLAVNSAGYLWLAVTGNSSPADYRGLINHPTGYVLISTFGYLDLDFVNGTGIFSDLGAYGFTYAEYQDALQGVEVNAVQVNAIPVDERDNYVYLISGSSSYDTYPPAGLPFHIIPVKKETGKINVGSYAHFTTPKMKKLIDFTRLYSTNGDDCAVLYLYDKKLPEYMGNFWGGPTPTTNGLVYIGNNTLEGAWIDTDLSEIEGAVFHATGRNASWKIPESTTPGLSFSKGYFHLLYNQADSTSNGFYLCTKDIKHEDGIQQLNRVGGYVPWTLPDWFKNKTGNFAFEIDISGITHTISGNILYVEGCPIYPGEPVIVGSESEWRCVYVWNTIDSNQVKLIASVGSIPEVILDSAGSQNITNQSDTHSHKFRIPKSDWESAYAGRSLDVWTGESSHYSFTVTNSEVTIGTYVQMKHAKESTWAYDKLYSYVVLNSDTDYIYLASTMVWIENPTLVSTVGYPGTHNAVVPRYNQELPNQAGNYYYNMKTVLSRLPARKMFEDFGWNIADYVDTDFQGLSLGEFLQECVIRSDLSIPKSPDTNRAYGLESTLNLYSKEDVNYTSGKIPDPAQDPIACSMTLNAKTEPKSFFDTAFYTARLADGSTINISNVEYPLWVTIAKSRSGRQTMSVSVVDDNSIQLDFSGNEGNIPIDKITWLDLLTGLGTGKSLDLLSGFRFRQAEDGCGYIIAPDGTRVYISSTEPTGEIPEGSIGIGF